MSERNTLHAKVGQVLDDRYRIIRFLGLGAVGMVYLAEDKILGGIPVAVKLLYPHLLADPVNLERFRSEVLIVRQLHHPNVVKIYEFEKTDDNQYFLVMEYLAGTTFAEILKGMPDRRLPLSAAIDMLHAIASGIAHAHEKSVVHRDLKPQNVLVEESGRVAVCDFGMARQLNSQEGLTRTGDSVGTPYYMAPELFRGEDADERTDVYAIGIIAYELVTGQKPFADEIFYSLALKHVESPIPRLPSELHIPAWFQDFILCATSKNRSDRYASASTITKLLAGHLDESTQKRQSILFQNWAEHEAKRIALERSRKRGRLVRISLLVFLLVVAISAFFSRTNSRHRKILGTQILKAERYLGPTLLWPLKRLYGIDVSLNPQDIRDLVFYMAFEMPKSDAIAGKVANARLMMLLDAGIDPNIEDERGVPLAATLLDTHEDLAKQFVLTGRFNGNVRTQNQIPLLHYAILKKKYSFQRALMELGHVDKMSTDSKGNTALHVAVDTRDPSTLSPFFQLPDWTESSIFRSKNKDGFTPLGLGLLDKRYPVDLLRKLANASEINAPIIEGKTPLILAAEHDNAPIIISLLRKGARVDARDDHGKTAIYYASRLPKGNCLAQFTVLAWAGDITGLLEDIPEGKRESFRLQLEQSRQLIRHRGDGEAESVEPSIRSNELENVD